MPFSPLISTVASVGATLAIMPRRRTISGLSPSSTLPCACSWLRYWLTLTTWLNASAFSTIIMIWLSEKGLMM